MNLPLNFNLYVKKIYPLIIHLAVAMVIGATTSALNIASAQIMLGSPIEAVESSDGDFKASSSNSNLPSSKYFGYPGTVVKIPLNSANIRPIAHFRKKRVVVTQENGQWFAWVAVSLSTKKGQYQIRWKQGKKTQSVAFSILNKDYPEQRLIIKNKRKVNPNKNDISRIVREKKIIRQVYSKWSKTEPNLYFQSPFPAEAGIIHSSKFGLKRFFNGQARRPHSGLDFAAPAAMDIGAIADGEVVLTGDFFFNGNSVFVHHGQGVVSFYCHMSKISVKKGDRISTGQTLGKVGATGRVTGAHLHLGVYFNGTAVDPEPLIQNN